MPRIMDSSTAASHPGGIRVSHSKLKRLRPALYNKFHLIYDLFVPKEMRISTAKLYIKEHLQYGDSRAAVVIHVNPLLIAAYTDEFDCVAMLTFPEEFVREYHLVPGTRLLTVNTYGAEGDMDPDLTPGPNHIKRWSGFGPYIAEFLSDDMQRIVQRKKVISEEEWARAEEMGKAYFAKHGFFARDGRPLKAEQPATLLH